ncbi:MAG: GldG family protein, partial [Elusimicrobia bacterium]|nr:GldG family protein [Elusimicrobiota bacterium]
MALTGVQEERRRGRLTSWTAAGLVLGILAAANFILSVVPLRFDSSSGHAYSITPSTKKVLSQLQDTLLVRIVFSPDLPAAYQENERYVSDLLSEYKRASHGKVRVELFNPVQTPKNREQAMDFGVIPVQLDVIERDRREVAEKFMGVAFFYGDKHEAIPFVQDVDGLEYEITLRIKKLIDPTKPSIAFLTDGDALALNSEPLEKIAEPLREIYDVKTLSAAMPIPEDVKAVWWISPRAVSSGTVHENIKAFLARGGALGLLVDQFDVNVAQFR